MINVTRYRASRTNYVRHGLNSEIRCWHDLSSKNNSMHASVSGRVHVSGYEQEQLHPWCVVRRIEQLHADQPERHDVPLLSCARERMALQGLYIAPDGVNASRIFRSMSNGGVSGGKTGIVNCRDTNVSF